MYYFLPILMTGATIISVAEDLRRQKIPNLLTFPCMLMALVYHSISSGLDGFLFSAGGLAVGLGFFIIPYLLGGMGAGDAKLMGAIGAMIGPQCIFSVSIIAYIAGGIYGVILMALHPKYAASFLRRLWTTFKTFVLTAQFIIIPPDKNEKQPILRFAIPIAVGTLSYVLFNLTGYSLFPRWLGGQFDIFSH